MVDAEVPEPGLFPQSVGERLRVLRGAAGLDLNDIGTKTRIPLRHLEAIERGDYAALPSQTYALGFTRSYARAVGGDEAALIAQLRIDLGREDPAALSMPYELADPARVPSRLLAWTAAFVALILVAGYLTWRSQYWGADSAAPTSAVPVADAPPALAPQAGPPPAVPTASQAQLATAPATGEVVLTAGAPVWVRIYDRGRTTLFEKEMAIGERYVVPGNAQAPMILTGRPDVLAVTVGGQSVAPLGTAEKSIKDVGVSAAALSARALPAAPSPATLPATPPAPTN